MSVSTTSNPSITRARTPEIEWDREPVIPPCTKKEIDTFPIRKVYYEIIPKVNDLNRLARNYNIETILKIALLVTTCFALGMVVAFAGFSLAGLAIPVAPWSFKAIAAMGIAFAGIKKIAYIFSRAMDKTQNEFLSKMNSELKKSYPSKAIKQALDQKIDASVYVINKSKFCRTNYSFTVSKVKFASYKTVEKIYVAIKIFQENKRREEIIKRQKEQDCGWSRLIPSFFRKAVSS